MGPFRLKPDRRPRSDAELQHLRDSAGVRVLQVPGRRSSGESHRVASHCARVSFSSLSIGVSGATLKNIGGSVKH